MPSKGELTIDAIAAFATTRSARFYAETCRAFGVDPAACIDDPFLAYQLRAALYVAPSESTGEDIGEEHRARVTATREAAERLRTWA